MITLAIVVATKKYYLLNVLFSIIGLGLFYFYQNN